MPSRTLEPIISGHPIPPRRLYLAIDCGGSKAAAAISISSPQPGAPPTFLSRGQGGAANYTDVGLERFLRSVQQAVENALDHGGIEWRHLRSKSGAPSSLLLPDPTSGDPLSGSASPVSLPTSVTPFPPLFFAAWLGIAGVDSSQNIAALSPYLSQLLAIPAPSPRLIVANDTSLLASPVLEHDDETAAEGVSEGVVCIAGTGSIVMSFRSRHQRMSRTGGSLSPASVGAGGGLLESVGRVGGFGWLLGDEGGGYMVGKKAVRAVLDQADWDRLVGCDEDSFDESEEETSAPKAGLAKRGQRCTPLLRNHILAHWGLNSTDDLLDTVYANDSTAASSSSSVGGQRASIATSAASSVPDSPLLSQRTSLDEGRANRQWTESEHRGSQGAGGDQAQGTSESLPAQADSSSSSKSQPQPIGSEALGDPGSASTEDPDRPSASFSRPTLQHVSTPPSPLTALNSSSVDQDGQPHAVTQSAGVRKLRLASLAPLVFDLAFKHGDETSLRILQGEIECLVDQIELLLRRRKSKKAASLGAEGRSKPSTSRLEQRRVVADRSVLCLGGSLLGVEGYRRLLVQQLKAKGWIFKRVVHVEDVARRGCEALARGFEGGGEGESGPSVTTSS